MTTPAEGDRESGKLRRFFSNHPLVGAIGVVGSLASVISVPLAIYLFFESYKIRELTYYVHPVRALVATTGAASRLSVNYDGKEITANVTAVHVALWNQGRETIHKSDILKPLIIQTEGEIPILEATIRLETRDVVGLRKIDESELDRGRLTISWDILEENDGGIVQLIYAGKTDVKITAAAVIEGQKNIKELAFSGAIKSPSEQYSDARRQQQWQALFTIGNGIVLGIFAFLNTVQWGHHLKLSDRMKHLESLAKMKHLESSADAAPQAPEAGLSLSSSPKDYLAQANISLILLQACSSFIIIGYGVYGLLFQRLPTPPFDF